MSNSTQIFLNDIILKIHTIDDVHEMRYHVLSALRYLIPSVGATFYLSAGIDSYRFSHPIFMGINEKEVDSYLNEFQDYDHTRWIYDTPSAKVYNDSAFIQAEALNSSDFYQKVHARIGTKYQITLRIIHNGTFLGVLALFRSGEQMDFTNEEVFDLELLGLHLGSRLYDYLITESSDTPFNRQSYDLLRTKYMFTDREAQITGLLLEDLSKEEMCEKLYISPNTLKKHITNMYKKLGVRNRTEFQREIRLAKKYGTKDGK